MHYERSLAIRRALHFPEGEGILVILLGLVAAREGNLVEARALYRDGLATIRELMGPWGLAMPLAALSHIAATNGQPGRAVRLGATATRLSDAYQTPLIPLIEPFLARVWTQLAVRWMSSPTGRRGLRARQCLWKPQLPRRLQWRSRR